MRTVFPFRYLSVLVAILAFSFVTPAEAQIFPNPPTSVQASDGTSTANVQVSWSPPVGGAPVSSYRVYRATTNSFCSGTVIGTVNAPTTSLLDTSGTPSAIYYYSVRAIGSAPDNLESNCSNTDSGYRAVLPPPLPPTDLTATNNLLDKIALTWQLPTSGEQVTGIQVFRATSQIVCGGAPVATLNTPATAYNDTDALPGQVYYYSLKSTGPTGTSACSSVPVQGFRLEPPPPLPPVQVSATDGTYTNKVNVSWVSPTGSTPITNYRLHRSQTPALCNSLLIDGVPAGSANVDDSNVVPGRLYYYSMDSFGPNGLSTCSQLDPGYARVSPPINLNASDGTFPDKVVLTFSPPSLGGDITGYQIFRGTSPGSACSGSPVVANQGASTFTYADSNVVPGTIYYYSMKTLAATGASDCSVIESGFPRIGAPNEVQATDGTFPDKIDVTWTAPTTGGAILGYTLYRDLTPAACQTVRVSGLGASTTQYSDTAVIPGTLYHYSVKTVSSTGESVCSPVDPGYARISPPENVSGTDGIHPDKVVVTWAPPSLGGSITGYELYKSSVPGLCTTLLNGNLSPSTLTFTDTATVPGTLYYYSLITLSPTGKSSCSTVDSGFAKAPVPICSDGLDNDGDGLVDLHDPGCKNDPNRNTEKNPDGAVCDNGLDDDGDGLIDYRTDTNGDPGCLSPTDESENDSDASLKSPAYIKFNTFLGQWNYAELINQGTKEKQVDVTVFNQLGQPMIARTFIVPPKNEVDVDVNSLIMFACDVLNSNCAGYQDLSKTTGAQNGLGRPDGVVDTYGLVELKFDDSDPNERLLGRMSFYRPSPDGQTFSFAFAREFKNPLKGPSAATANTYDPQGFGNLVPNWAEIINLSGSNQSYTVNIYNQEGALRQAKTLSLAPLGEFDVQAGHEFVGADGKVQEGVFLVEVVPADKNAPYSFSVSRYSSTAQGGGAFDPSNYNFAFAIEASAGSIEPLFVPIANVFENVSGLASTVSLTNWLEVVNAGSTTAHFHINFRDANGTVVSSTGGSAAPKSQVHFNASALLSSKTSGQAEIISDAPLVVQSLSYLHGSKNELQSGFVIPARNAGRAQQAGSINTFLGMQNVFGLLSTSATNTTADFTITAFTGGVYKGSIGLSPTGASTLGLSNNPSLNLPSNTYGAILVDTGAEGAGLADIRRVRIVGGAVDFVMPTGVR
ncbi:MAG: fibronectin type III domain-containing protein [Bdellovibrionota bacterium]